MKVKQEGVRGSRSILGSPWRSGILVSALTDVVEVSFHIKQKALRRNLNLVLGCCSLSFVGEMQKSLLSWLFFYFTNMGRDWVPGGLVKSKSFWLWASICKISPRGDRRPPRACSGSPGQEEGRGFIFLMWALATTSSYSWAVDIQAPKQ